MESGLAENVRNFRRTAGLSQEGLAEGADLSVSVVRKVEQGGDVRMETLHALARTLGISTSSLFAPGATTPVVGDETNRRNLVELRKALMPPVGLTTLPSEPGEEAPELEALRRGAADCHALCRAAEYSSVARMLPGLLRNAESAVAALEGEKQQVATMARTEALLVAGMYLTQIRQYDMAYFALAEAIRIARETGRTLTAASGVARMCWLLVRQDRFDESEQLATRAAAEIEPRMSDARPEQLAMWGELGLEVASAAVRNNRPEVAQEARRMAGAAASALGEERDFFPLSCSRFGPVTAELKSLEDRALLGDARAVLSRAGDGLLSDNSLRKLGKPTVQNWNRHRLDVVNAHVTLKQHHDAIEELMSVRRSAGEWIVHQPLARYAMTDILKTRKRTLTRDMREMAAHLGVTG